MSLTVSIKIKDLFFDRHKVIRAMDRASRRALSRAGAFIRTTARSSIRTRGYNTHAPAGSPPFDHAGFAISRENRRRRKAGRELVKRSKVLNRQGLKAILFGYDEANKSVVIGPVGFGSQRPEATVPHLQEFGGQTRNGRGRQVTIRPHPFMAPALKKELPNLPAKWRSSISA